MKLYDGGRAPNPRRVRVFLAEKGIDVPLVPVDMGALGHREPEIASRNPLRRLPVLELDDGTVLTESVAICRYFEELHPEPPLFGEGALGRGIGVDKARVGNHVVVEKQQHLAARMLDGGIERVRLAAKRLGEEQGPRSCREILQQPGRAVGAGIVDDDRFHGLGGPDDFGKRRKAIGERVFPVVGRNDQRPSNASRISHSDGCLAARPAATAILFNLCDRSSRFA